MVEPPGKRGAMTRQFSHLHSRYIYQQGARFYFRRRIPGLSPKTTPVVIPLGTTDHRSASILLGRLVVEFDRMISSLNMFAPALPEELVLKYMTTSLRQVLPEFHSAVRIERMTGRGLQDGAWYREIQKLAVLTLLEDGVHKTLPSHRIDPKWTPKQLEAVLRIYKLELDRVTSPEARQDIARKFTDMTGTALNSREHHAQVREADLKIRLAALCDVTNQRRQDFLSEADALLTAVSATKAPDVADANQPREEVPAAPLPQTRNRPVFPGAPSVKLIEADLTIGALMEQFNAAQTAVANGNGAYTRDIYKLLGME
jgi:hypothetical protein